MHTKNTTYNTSYLQTCCSRVNHYDEKLFESLWDTRERTVNEHRARTVLHQMYQIRMAPSNDRFNFSSGCIVEGEFEE